MISCKCHLKLISALFCLSTYSGNFLVDDQFLALIAHSSLFGLSRPSETSRVYPLMGAYFDLFLGQSVLSFLKKVVDIS
jgi:hypothetical protein